MDQNTKTNLTILGTSFLLAIGFSASVIYLAMPNKRSPQKTQTAQEVWPKEVLEELAKDHKEEQKQMEIIFYESSLEVIENANREFSDFETNLSNYKGHNPQSQIKFTYLAQANESILSIGQDIDRIRTKAQHSGFLLASSPRLEQKSYNAKVAQQQLMHEYAAELRNVFTAERIVDVPFDVEKYSIHRNTYTKSLKRELISLSDLLNEEARKTKNTQ